MSLAPLVPLFAAGAFLLLVGATLLDAKPAVARNLYPEPGTTIGTAGQASAPGDPLFGPIPCEEGEAAGYSCENVDLLAHLPLSTFAASSASDVWGWQDPQTGKEYAILGVSDGTVFVELSETARPVYLGKLPTASAPSLWHDVKVYDHYALAISEAAGHGLQIFDLHRLREVDSPPVTFAATAYYGGFGGAHNLAVNPESGFAYVVGAEQGQPCGGGLHMIDISTPASPSFAGCYSAEGMIHDTHFDTYPPHDAGGYYYGAWTAYPYFEDKVVVSTIGEGLFILRPRLPGD